jgi:Tol biopolymer transport system component
MKKNRPLAGCLMLALALGSCTYATSPAAQQPVQPTVAAASPVAIGPTRTPASATVAGPASTSIAGAETAAPPTQSLPPPTSVPVTWSDLDLSGRLVYMIAAAEYDKFNVDIQTLDLQTGKVVTDFSSPTNSWIYYATVSPDGRTLAMSYAPPPENGPAQPSAGIYIMPPDGSQQPELLFAPPKPGDQELQVEWSPDGSYIYYTQADLSTPPQPNQVYPIFEIYRRPFPAGEPEPVAEQAYWPRLSADGSRLVYVHVDPFSYVNELYLADPDGSHPQRLGLSGPSIPDTKDAPIFLPDGVSVMFSGPAPLPAGKRSWIEALLGIQSAKADGSIPSDWWSVPKTGGDITQLTHLQTLALYASISPDGRYIASFSADGIFVMRPDGSSVTTIIPTVGGLAGTLTWLP